MALVQGPHNYDWAGQENTLTALATVSFQAAGLFYINVQDLTPANATQFPHLFVLRVGKGNFARMIMSSSVLQPVGSDGSGAVTLSWDAVVGGHALNAVKPEGMSNAVAIPPPRCVIVCLQS